MGRFVVAGVRRTVRPIGGVLTHDAPAYTSVHHVVNAVQALLSYARAIHDADRAPRSTHETGTLGRADRRGESLPRTTLTAALFAAAVFAAAQAHASAQSVSPTPAPKPSPTPTPAPAPSPTPYKLITLSGSADAGYTSVAGTTAARFVGAGGSAGGPSRVFDASTGAFFDANGGRQLAPVNDFNNTFDLQNANLQMLLNGPFVSGKIEASFGSDADVIASNGQSRSGVNLTNAYLQATRGAYTFIAGKFSTLAGAEVIEAPGNSNYSRSYLFGYAVPFTHTGVRLTYAYNPKISVVVGANNGWDDWKFAGKKKTLEGGLLLTPSAGYSLTLDTYNGNDFAVNGNSTLGFPPVYTNRMLYDGVLTVHPSSALTLVANYDNGTQLADGTGLFPTSHWNGIAGYANYQFNGRFGLSLRKETFHDLAGFRTGIVQRLQSNTATINFTPSGNLLFRAEYRLDASDGNNFFYTGSVAAGAGRPHQSSLGLESIVKFP
jgi:hypothetical protein